MKSVADLLKKTRLRELDGFGVQDFWSAFPESDHEILDQRTATQLNGQIDSSNQASLRRVL